MVDPLTAVICLILPLIVKLNIKWSKVMKTKFGKIKIEWKIKIERLFVGALVEWQVADPTFSGQPSH
ncbi:MAG: hypothetical protein CL670_12535 [Balneola sp.]|nr:hypothetical protein [Balneola sp.]MBE79974.1 hypothetical protein [Balneola sp.]